MKRSISLIALLLASAVICGCSSLGIYTPLNRRPENTSTNLCVGITIDNPPMSFKENDRITGMEAEFAARLAEELNLNREFMFEIFKIIHDGSIRRQEVIMNSPTEEEKGESK